MNELSEDTQSTIKTIERMMAPHVGTVEISAPFAYVDYMTDNIFLTFSVDQDGACSIELELNRAWSEATPKDIAEAKSLFASLLAE